MPNPETLADLLRKWDEISPMKTRLVSSQEELEAAVAEMKAKGLRVAAISDAGLTAPKKRVTFLPESAFTGDPSQAETVIHRRGFPALKRPPRDVREILAEIDGPIEPPTASEPPPPPEDSLPPQKRDPSEAPSAMSVLAEFCGLLPSRSEPESHS